MVSNPRGEPGVLRRIGRWLVDALAPPGSRRRRALHRYVEARRRRETSPGSTGPDPRVLLRALLSDPRSTLAFPVAERPEVSIVVITYNKVEHSYHCLVSLLAHADAPYELVLVDNASRDETGELLGRLRNATVLRNETNLGFGKACNQAAARARGDYLLFLNNDAELAPHSLSALLDVVRGDPRIGAAGGRLVWPDGRLQEAGGILWRDGSAEAYGRGSDPFAPDFSYRRDVDFCSGALLLVRRELFEALGGFDERFAPAYYEDADLCMSVRARGYRVVYEPRATVRHHEYGSSSIREATELIRRNHARFAEKWKDELPHQLPPSRANHLRARERVARPRLLVVDDRVPTSDVGSGYPRAHALLRLLRRHEYPVTLFPSHDATPYQPWLADFQRAGVEVICDGRPFTRFASERAGHYDLVIVSRPHNFRVVREAVRQSFPRAVVIYDAEALFFVREALKAAIGVDASPPADVSRQQQEELDLLRSAHHVLVVSERDKLFVERAAPDLLGRVSVWGHPVECRPTPRPFGERRHLLFVGSFFAARSPNEDALSFFVSEVLPIIHRQIDCRLQVVGYNAPAAVGRLASASVEVVGRVDDLTPFYDTSRVFVAPHRLSAGIPLKLCESMARGIPAVVSSLTASQLGVEDGREVLVGGTASELADRVVELYSNEVLWNRLRTNALEFVRRHHDPDTLGRELDAILSRTLAAGSIRS